MRYKIFLNGEHINTIIADEAFCVENYSHDGYSYELEELEVIPPTPVEPTTDELLNILLGGIYE